MDINTIPIFRMINDKMRWLTQRQRVLAQNVSNADTPKYQARDLKSVDFRKEVAKNLFQVVLNKTDAKHISFKAKERFKVVETRHPYETAPSGNAVVLEEQMIKVQQTAADYRLMTSLYKKHLGMFRTALGRAQ